MLGRAPVRGVEGRGDDVHAQDHPCAAAVRLVVHLRARKRGRVAIAEQAQVQLVAEHGRNGPLLRQPREGVRNQGEDVELQRRRCSG